MSSIERASAPSFDERERGADQERDALQTSALREGAANNGPEPSGTLANQRRWAILKAASQVISRRGVHRTRLVDIADEAHVSVGMIQHYFRSRNNLVRETFQWKLEESLASYGSRLQDDSTPWQHVESLCRMLTREPFEAINSLWLEFFSLCNRDPEFATLGSELWQRWSGRVRSVIESGIESGEFTTSSSPDDVAARFVSLADGLGIRVLIHHKGMSIDRMHRLLLEGAARELGVTLEQAPQPAVDSYQTRSPASGK